MTQNLLLFHSPDFQNWKESSIEPCMLEAASTQAAGENSFDSEYFTFLSTTSKPHPIEEHDKADAKVGLSSDKGYS